MLEVGQVLDGKFRILRLIGEGGMGSVYEALHVFLGRHVAIKVLAPDFAHNQEAVRRFYREAQAAAAIGHENICEVTDIGQTDGSPYIVMQLLQGKSLSAAIAEAAPLPMGRAVDIASQALDALGAAHAAGIVHRDMKPDNVYLTKVAGREDFVKLLDFGISKVRHAGGATKLTQEGSVLGTPQYMSPEQARGETDVDGRADIWAVGIIIFEMLTGRIPFDGENYNKILWAVLMGPIPRLRALRAGITPELEAVVMRALERDVDRRFATTVEFRDALVQAWMSQGESGFAVKAGPPTPPSFGDDATELASAAVLAQVAARQAPGPRPAQPAAPVAAPPLSHDTAPTVSSVFVVGPPTAAQGPSSPSGPPTTPRGQAAAAKLAARGTVEVTPGATIAGGPAATTIRQRERRVPVIPLVIGAAALTGIAVFLLVRGTGGSGNAAAPDAARTAAAFLADAVAVPTPPPATPVVASSETPDAGPVVEQAKPSESPLPPPTPPIAPLVEAGAVTPLDATPLDVPIRDGGREVRDSVPSSTRTGTLSVTTVPWTNVYLDDQFLARAPFAGRTVPAGRHHLRLVNEVAGVDVEETVDVPPNGVTSFRRTATQLGASATSVTAAGSADAGGRVSGPPDAGRAQDAVRFRLDVYRRDAR